jgi:hypothetical protein
LLMSTSSPPLLLLSSLSASLSLALLYRARWMGWGRTETKKERGMRGGLNT